MAKARKSKKDLEALAKASDGDIVAIEDRESGSDNQETIQSHSSPLAANSPPFETECPKCLGHPDLGVADPRCPACEGTGYVATPRGEELMRFLAREGITPGIPAVMPPGRVPAEEAPPRIPPPPSAFEEGDTATFHGRRVQIASATYQWNAEPKGWVYTLTGTPGLVKEKELLEDVPDEAPVEAQQAEGG